MSAKEKISLDTPKRIGIIAGGGSLPEMLLYACDKKNIEVFLVGIEGQTDRKLMAGRNHLYTGIGSAGQIINTLKAHNYNDLVLIGAIRRPSLAELKPDMKTAQFFARVGLKALGDDGLLKALREELESEGFVLHGVQKFVDDLIIGKGAIGRQKVKKNDQTDIELGFKVSKTLGSTDVGQAVIVQEGLVLGVEAIEGTNELIRRCMNYKRSGAGPILVKTSKPNQDRDLDLPTVGPETAELCAAAGMRGIVLEAGNSLLIKPDAVAEIANKAKMFVVGIDPKDHV